MLFASSTRSYGNLKDSDRIFTNLYKDDDPFIAGALRRVILLVLLINTIIRAIGIKPKTFYQMGQIGLLMRSKNQDFEVVVVQDFLLDLSIHLCLKSHQMEGKFDFIIDHIS